MSGRFFEKYNGERQNTGLFNVCDRPYRDVNAPRQPSVKMAVISAAAGDGYTLEVAIPWNLVGVAPKEGLELLFDLAVDDSSDGTTRNCQLMYPASRQREVLATASAWPGMTP